MSYICQYTEEVMVPCKDSCYVRSVLTHEDITLEMSCPIEKED